MKDIIVKVKEKAEHNKSNVAVIKLLSKDYNVLPQSIKIKKSLKNSRKVIKVF